MKLPMPFANPYTYAGHGGIDYAHPQGTPIRAIADGVISFSGWWNNRAGNTRTLTLDNGLQIMHCHLESLNGPRIGTRVRAGEVIAYVGWTGHVVPANERGSHLHQEIWLNGVKQAGSDYWKWIDRDRVIDAGSAAGGGSAGEEDDMFTDEDRRMLIEAHEAAIWQKQRTGGKLGQPTITELLRMALRAISALGAGIDWLKVRTGGSTKSAPTITDELRGLRDTDDA